MLEVPGYGKAPTDLGQVNVRIEEMMFYLYLPIKLAADRQPLNRLCLPKRLWPVMPLLSMIPPHEYEGRYVYLTCKHTHVTPENMCNRPGWHCDGYMTEDINYLWHSVAPTEFCEQPFYLSQDDQASLVEMKLQAKQENIKTYPNRHLLRIDEKVVHRVAPQGHTGLRTFIKVSVSNLKYNLVGNSKNHLLDYDWLMYDRAALRNMEHNGDSYDG